MPLGVRLSEWLAGSARRERKDVYALQTLRKIRACESEAAALVLLEAFVATHGAAYDVVNERVRQREVECYSAEHDDHHGPNELAKAAACYAIYTDAYPNRGEPPSLWPWSADAWKPKAYRDDLKRASALLIAAMECLDRQDARMEGRR